MIAKRNVVLLIGTLGAIFTAEMVAGQAVDQIVAAENRRIQQAQAAQDQIDETQERTRDIVDEYRAVTKEVDGLVVYNTLLQRQITDQEEELNNLRTSIDSVTVIERQILPLLTRMIEGLERFVALDMPFLLEERTDRVESLASLLERADVTAAEKFRVVMEAWQIENEYGRTIETYTGELEIDGTNREVDFLRIGRVILVYQTPDGASSGVWDQANRQWVAVGSDYRNSIRQGLRLARGQASPEILLLPVAAPEEG
jgi:predicted RNase H-like nuclease (RuvC/YqgF family)